MNFNTFNLFLTAKIIEVKPYPWLEFLVKSSKKIDPELCKILNSTLQGEKGQKSDLYTFWWGRFTQALTIHREDIQEGLKNFAKMV